MSINLFFVFLLLLLVGMFNYFKPSAQEVIDRKETPQFELEAFTIYEISPVKIDRFFEGEHGVRFSDRYLIKEAKFTNNKNSLLESISSSDALYKEERVTLKGDVHYQRSDGLEIRSAEAIYDHNQSFIKTDSAFRVTKGGSFVEGNSLFYDLNLKTLSADQVQGSYTLN